MSAQSSPVKAAFLFPYTVAVDIDLILCSTSTAYLVERWKRIAECQLSQMTASHIRMLISFIGRNM